MTRTLIGGVGYGNLRDGSVGPVLIAELRAEPWPDGVELEDLSYGPIAVMQRLQDADPRFDRLVLVAAVRRGRPPGTVIAYRWKGTLPDETEIQARVAEAVTGVISLDNLLIVAGFFEALPEEVQVVEVEPEDEGWGEGFSPPVEAARPEIVDTLRRLALGTRRLPAVTPRALVVGVGNVLRGDDGFGVEVAKRLAASPAVTARAKILEIGIGGVHLVQELMAGYDLLVIADAVDRGAEPGRLSVLDLEVPTPPSSSFDAWQDRLTDLHEAVPSRTLVMAKALGVLPTRVLLVGCQPLSTDELRIGLSAPVEAAVSQAVERIRTLLDPLEDLKRRDEILTVMFWLHGEGLGSEVTAADLLRFLDDTPALETALARLADDGYVEVLGGGSAALRYHLTPFGQEEARRRFLDEFEPYLARHAHGECGAADCDCHAGRTECRGGAA